MNNASRAFRYLTIFSALLFFVLAAIWLFAPAALLANWGVVFDGGVSGLVGRRAAPLYAGIGVALLLSRNAPPSPGRTAVVAGFVTTCSLLALLGLVEWVMGNVESGILPAVLVEVALALAFLFVAGAEGRAKVHR
ncbi:hypothetical protein SAMN03159382_01777 [Pseudomonas sp. NFACC23-1]|uniref:hypothetical protein n=1 Tax=unclassified Pseudomonas TaxID=196821 RepID=UPI000881B5E2|nr:MULTISPECIES: hypothetical protein [unclassified Pseudomonas]SDB20444.1 hypothetical protein SAMN03159386_01484 [Pseudomonas sp. NFACC17-2]SEJ26864.1 hypothetical protein SAMN03159382_01777 [Pseudomonas sp. NFACC23-1]SFW84195.1 hypothetical protein SAMN05660640_04231 [Pseudomonas sp. NFACC16-2]